MSPLKRKQLNKIRSELDKVDNSLIKIIKKINAFIGIAFLIEIASSAFDLYHIKFY